MLKSYSFGSVYWGIVNEEEGIVAVKVLDLQTSRESFLAECETLKSVRHRNIVKLLTACSSIDFQGNDFKALLYEFMVNGSLEEWLHLSGDGAAGEPVVALRYFNLLQRLNIAIDIASAVDYLHNHSHMPIVHCDLKPRNVFLEGDITDMTARVGDFGLARFLHDGSHGIASNAIKGSIGYTAPEYGMGNEVSTFGDVYSYGILLLELFTGKRPTNDMFKDDLNLHKYVLMALPERVEEVCDPLLLPKKGSSSSTSPRNNRKHVQNVKRQRVDQECLIAIARIGVACSAYSPRERMNISNVVVELCLIRDVLIGTRVPRDHTVTA